VPFSPPADLFGEQGIIVLVVIAVVLFGSTQIPKLARSLGSAQKEFKKGLDEGAKGDGTETQSLAEASPPPAVQAPPAAQPQAGVPVPPTADGTPGANP
jgi:sec-independent protein translocase protein TatA